MTSDDIRVRRLEARGLEARVAVAWGAEAWGTPAEWDVVAACRHGYRDAAGAPGEVSMTLRRVTLAALAATAAAFLVRAVATFNPGAFDRPATALAGLVLSPVAATVVPLVASILAVAFFGALVAATRDEALGRPALAGLLGTLALALGQAVVVVRLVAPGAAALLPEPTRDLAIVVSPLGAGAFAAVVYFFWAFSGEVATPGPARPPGRSR